MASVRLSPRRLHTIIVVDSPVLTMFSEPLRKIELTLLIQSHRYHNPYEPWKLEVNSTVIPRKWVSTDLARRFSNFREVGRNLFEPTKQRDIGNFRLLNTAKLACPALDLIRTKSFSWNYSSFDHFFKACGDYDIDEPKWAEWVLLHLNRHSLICANIRPGPSSVDSISKRHIASSQHPSEL